KVEGQNPTGSFKDRGMVVAVAKSLEAGARMVLCASTGNTAASAAAYAARGGLSCTVVLPAGQVAAGKLAQAIAHGARVVAVRGPFDAALAVVRSLAEQGEATLVNSVNPDRLEGEDRRVRGLRGARRCPGRAFHSGRECRQHHRVL